MKTIFFMTLVLASSLAQASKVRSIGEDLICFGDAYVSAPFFKCNTGDGPSDWCTDDIAAVKFRFNIVRGDLRSGVAGDLHIVKINEDSSKNKNSDLDKKLLSFVQKTSGFVSYKDGKIEQTVKTPLGQKTIVQKADFSKGVRTSEVMVSLSQEVYYEEMALVFETKVFCDAGNGVND